MFHVKHDSNPKQSPSYFDVIVIGGGHAGCEAAAAAARMGCKTALVTKSFSDLGMLSCNPAIGGLGKGQIVREIDALDGLMARVADLAGLQFRVLNSSRGPATRGPRAQMDRNLYARAMQALLVDYDNLTIAEGLVSELHLERNKVSGLNLTDGRYLKCGAIVLTTGTFLRGLIHIGRNKFTGGRINEPAAVRLGENLEKIGLLTNRLKTGTPARLDGKSIEWDRLEKQTGDITPEPFSYMTGSITTPQRYCYLTRTVEATHVLIRENLQQSPLFDGSIQGRGPRYCPSIEDKVTRFADRSSHQIFLEPEGYNNDVVYPNGISTSLPAELQTQFIATIPGLENAKILQSGYAIEYDYFDPRGLYPSLQSKHIESLFLAGQVNGTTGYEEAAGQGLIAGINAACIANGRDTITLGRDNSYIGVMIDDLTTKGVTEPYRMFTSRAEFRLHLRADNADMRLTPLGIRIGCVSNTRQGIFDRRLHDIVKLSEFLQNQFVTPHQLKGSGLVVNQDGIMRSAFDILSRNNVSIAHLIALWPEIDTFSIDTKLQVDTIAKYSVYLDRQNQAIATYRKHFESKLPENFDYNLVPGLSNEIKSRLNQFRPQSLAQADRLEGITPAAMALLAGIAHKRAASID